MKADQQNENKGNIALKGASVVTLVLLLALLLFSLFFFKERMLFIDAPHILFRIINNGQLQITEHRYGSFITQVFPLAATRLHCSLKAIMLIYSASFYLFFTVVALALVFYYRQYGLAILLGLYLTLFASDTFYWPNNEVHQGIAWLLLAFAANFHLARKNVHLVAAAAFFALSFFLAIWTHPLVMIAAIYLWIFFYADKTSWPYTMRQSIVYSAILVMLAFIKFYYGMHHGYDSGKIETVTQFHPRQLVHIISSPQMHYFVKGCISNYWLFVLLSIAGLTALIKERKLTLLALTIVFAMGYIVLVCITYWDAQAPKFYIESEYMPLAIIGAAPFVYYFLPKLSRNNAMIAMVLIFTIRLAYIVHAAPAFSNRITATQLIQDKMKAKGLYKVIIPDTDKTIDSTLIMNWGAPVESILLSGLNNETPQRTFIFLDTGQIRTFNTASRDTLLGNYEKRAVSDLNSRYFVVDTTTLYKVIDYKVLMK